MRNVCIRVAAALLLIAGTGTTCSVNPPRDSENESGRPGVEDAFGGLTAEQRAEAFSADVRPTDPLAPEEERKTFRLPEGFEIQLFASEPNIGKPFNMAFDARGRLWVTQSAAYPFPAEEGASEDRITILEDTDSDGQADRFTVFAQDLNIPIGVLPVKGGALVYSIPYVYRLFDTNGDDRADHRIALMGRFGYRDTHGMVSSFTRGFDGWVYACHGFTNTSHLGASDGSDLTLESGNTFRFKIDGSQVEKFTDGQVNPFGLSFDALGNLFSADCHSRPVYQLLHGGDYPTFQRTTSLFGLAPEMISHEHGSTAIAGIAYYAADRFPPSFRDNVFTGNVITSRVNRDSLRREGSTLIAIHEPDFIVTGDPWFRPVDLKIGPDGALYIADFYNRIIGHWEVPLDHEGRDKKRGRIWRVTYRGEGETGKAVESSTDWTKATLAALVKALSHSNLTVRSMAADQLVDRFGMEAAAPLRDLISSPEANPWAKAHGLWVLQRLSALDRSTVERAATDGSPEVRTHVMRILAEQPLLEEWEQELARQALADDDPFVERLAADALARHPRLDNLEPLLRLRARVPPQDTHLLYVVRQALRNQMAQPEILAATMARGWDEAEQRYLADVVVGVETENAAQFVLGFLKRSGSQDARDVRRFLGFAARYAAREELGEIVRLGRQMVLPVEDRLEVFEQVQQSLEERGTGLTQGSRRWGRDIMMDLLASREMEAQREALELAGLIRWEPLEGHLTEILGSPTAADELRMAAAGALMSIHPEKHAPLLGSVLRDTSNSRKLRFELVRSLGRSPSSAATEALVEAITVAPLGVDWVVLEGQRTSGLQNRLAYTLLHREGGPSLLLDLAEKGKLPLQTLVRSTVRMEFQTLPVDLRTRYERLVEGVASEGSEVDALILQRARAFDPATATAARGHEVFLQTCSKCHQLGGEGKVVGPQLDGIGNRGVERLVEDILDPSRNVDQAFRTEVVRLQNGTLLTGLVVREEGQLVTLVDETGAEVPVSVSKIESRRQATLSPMPGDFADQLSEGDFNDVLAFLLTSGTEKASTREADLLGGH